MMLSNVMAERPPTNEEEKAKADEARRRACQSGDRLRLPAFLASPEAANIPRTAKADLTAQLHYTLGLIYLHQKKLGRRSRSS